MKTKKTYSFFLAIMLFSLAQGQAVVKFNQNHIADKAIVRYWQQDFSIAYIQSGQNGYHTVFQETHDRSTILPPRTDITILQQHTIGINLDVIYC